MKASHLFLIIVTCTLVLFAASGQIFAASAKKQENTVTDTAGMTSTGVSDEKKAVGKEKKEIPTNVDINTADKDLLTEIPGIGPVTAEAIIAYRQENGNFKSLDELAGVKGIGEKNLAKLKPYLMEI